MLKIAKMKWLPSVVSAFSGNFAMNQVSLEHHSLTTFFSTLCLKKCPTFGLL